MALIYPNDREDAQRLARQLLDAAGEERHDEVRTTTDGALGLAFEVPDDLAEAVLGTGDDRVVQPSLESGRPAESAPAETGGEDAPAEPGGESVPAEAGEESASAVAGVDVSEVDAKVDGASQPSPRASRSSRASRSAAGR